VIILDYNLVISYFSCSIEPFSEVISPIGWNKHTTSVSFLSIGLFCVLYQISVWRGTEVAFITEETIEKARNIDLLFLAQQLGESLQRSGQSFFTYRNGGENTPSLSINPTKHVWKDFGGTAGGKDAISFYCYRKYDDPYLKGKDFVQAVEEICELCGIPIEYQDGGSRTFDDVVYKPRIEIQKESPKASPGYLHEVYSKWIKQFDLKKPHLFHLKEVRKIGPQVAKIRMYRSYSDDMNERYGITKQLASKGVKLDGVPGFAVKEGKYGPYWTSVGRAGLLIPFRSINNEIQGFQIMFDEKPANGQKYGWFSSPINPEKGTIQGAEIGNPVLPYHAAVPAQVLLNWILYKGELYDHMDTDTVWWGEGGLKGDIASNYTKQIHLQVPGVNNWRLLLEPTISLRPKRVIFSFDADAQTKEDTVQTNVLNSIEGAKKELKPHGIELGIALWPVEKGKGIDDLVNNGYKPQIVSI